MQETPTPQEVVTGTAETEMAEYLNAAVMQTESLQKILDALRQGRDLSLATWNEAFDASHNTLEHINKAMILAQEVFDRHVTPLPGFMAGDLTCNEFECMTWK